MPRLPRQTKRPKPHSFSEDQIRASAKALWEQRGEDSTDDENWADAIRLLQRERALKQVTKPLRRLWWRTGLGAPLQRWWEWTGIREKKGWDVAQILVGISIPIVLFVGGQYFTSQNNEKQQQLADDKAKQDTLVKYLDQMADSLQHGLLKAKPGEDQFIVAQSRTVLALQSLDKKRRNLIIQFLNASGLNDYPSDNWQPVDKQGQLNPLPAKSRVLLYKAQLSEANLVNSDLIKTVLVGANLSFADLDCDPPESQKHSQCSDLSGADLRGADLVGAKLNGADLVGAYLNSADLWGTDFSFADLTVVNFTNANLRDTNLSKAILLAANLRHAKALTPEQLEGKEPPLLCNVALPKGFTANPNRDCDRLPQILLERHPIDFKTLKDAEGEINRLRLFKWPEPKPLNK